MMKRLKNHRLKMNTKIVLGILSFIFCCHILAIVCQPFAEFYRRRIFHGLTIPMEALSGLFPFSVGEVMICFALLLIPVTLVVFGLGFLKKPFLKSLRRCYFRGIVYILLYVYFTETFYCFILYRTKSLEQEILSVNKTIEQERLYGKAGLDNRIDKKVYILSEIPTKSTETVNNSHAAENAENAENTENGDIIESADITDIEKLLLVYNHVVTKLNELAPLCERAENGDLIGKYDYADCQRALQSLSAYYPLLKGYYPKPKKIYYSEIMSQQYLAGIYFPFSMEANYNTRMYSANKPSVICHELCHLKGYIREDEANFLAFVACINSDNVFLQYSGYLSVCDYLENDLYRCGSGDILSRMVEWNEYVLQDDIFLKQEDFEKIEQNAILSTETLSQATDSFLESNLVMNGVSSGMENYREVVKLLLLYYGL